MGERNYIDLLELQTRIKESIADAFPGRYWVKAEIASWSPRANGHCYLSLSQSRGGKSVAEARAMIWSWKYPSLTRLFETGTGEPLRAGIAEDAAKRFSKETALRRTLAVYEEALRRPGRGECRDSEPVK